ncbi:hypothetical protein [Streptomyces lavenduligriseus]|uniref:Integral membrane protein n=1 Tax=Streptomyces lavenduligriseus TaxID=67315 RepID=A0ABT0P0X0_9ACTN|nr:hypothetical protein [Streptomyces lavenduligriseus]MCL3997365.1 hypothetical protein [Streptomyces lavenduligriseus]
MSPNSKRALAHLIAVLVSAIVGLIAAICAEKMMDDATGWTCLAVSGAAFAAMFGLSATVIGQFQFTDTRLPQSPTASQVPPSTSGTPTP